MLEELQQQLADTPLIDWVAMVTGIMGVWLSIREKVAAWLFFIICYSCYIYISYDLGLHAFLGMNIVFVGISGYGWLKWAGVFRSEQAELPITWTAKRHLLYVFIILVAVTGGGGWLLAYNGEAQLPYLDAFATGCGFAAQWMLGRKHIETWAFWLITDLIYLGIFFQNQVWPSVILFATFSILAIKGWKEWHPIVRRSV